MLSTSHLFIVGYHHVFVTSMDLSINTRFNFSDTHFCFSNEIANMNSVPNSELQLLCLLQRQQVLLDEQAAILLVRRRRRIRNRRRGISCWVRLWFSKERRLQFGHYDHFGQLNFNNSSSIFSGFLRMLD